MLELIWKVVLYFWLVTFTLFFALLLLLFERFSAKLNVKGKGENITPLLRQERYCVAVSSLKVYGVELV